MEDWKFMITKELSSESLVDQKIIDKISLSREKEWLKMYKRLNPMVHVTCASIFSRGRMIL